MTIHSSAVAVLSSLLAIGVALPSRADPEVKPLSGPWENGQFSFSSHRDKTRRSLSGIACPAAGSRCLVVFDEGTTAHYVTISGDGYSIDNAFVELLPSSPGKELDAEGATTDGKYFFITGSHSVKRNSCDDNPDSRYVIRFALDPASGKARMDGPSGLSGYKATGALWEMMARHPLLKDSVGERKCLGTESPRDRSDLTGKRGVNIEGIAARDGQLHFGFRGPAKDGHAPIFTAGSQDLFESSGPDGRVTMLRVGKGRGIRDLAPVKDGILVLAGPDDDKRNAQAGWVVGLWDAVPAARVELKEPTYLALKGVKLRDCDKELKPEALAVIGDRPDAFDIVVLSDGMCDGGPLRFTIPRKR
ncbi:DUF3616 domain-containing protein [Bradyrhizobium brasilense]|uniref:DUF3616 domain-containing protein n=1 Tax=Bradyrhizobium brasilense TaxID=1419277 RepID=UPI0024B0ED90|nr:DUF3616 domain-containing protein [Bradyrhizobium australafricanum]WFU31462.1 DUF3616 domain-containing protein [Bradyrhizobium australafricanum]